MRLPRAGSTLRESAGQPSRRGTRAVWQRHRIAVMSADRPVFYWKPTCTTCRSAREFLRKRGVDVDERDINRTPPSRAFLERHIDARHFLDYVSRRSPVFRQRPLPSSKREAIDLMVEQPNLIKRPILVDGRKVVFGFDREAYAGI